MSIALAACALGIVPERASASHTFGRLFASARVRYHVTMRSSSEPVFLRRQGIKCRALAYSADAGTADKLVRLAQELFDRANEIEESKGDRATVERTTA